jgi:pimeloyl-ACP methyl ester carboxylesterase
VKRSNLRPLVVFSHGNSFPASTYRVMLDQLRERGFAVEALEMFGHDPRYPVSSNWPNLVQELIDFVQPMAARYGQTPFLIGHSLGGLLSLMAAARAPELARGVVLLDSPVVGGWQARVVQVAKKIPLVGRFSPGAVSRKRRFQWLSLAEAKAHFAGKRAFAQWDVRVLDDYVLHGTVDEPGPHGTRRVLKFSREVETSIYNTIPDHLPGLLRRQPLRCPVALVAGLESREMRLAGNALTDQVIRGRKILIDGTHLFPMEKPTVTAACVEASLLNLMSLKEKRRSAPESVRTGHSDEHQPANTLLQAPTDSPRP